MTAAEIFGVDFSGAEDAGKRIWIAEGTARGLVSITDCYPARELPGSGIERGLALRALRELIGSRRHAVFGIDVPFGLPAPLANATSWRTFATAFVGRHGNAAAFKQACLAQAGGRELRRDTDLAARTPFSAYNLRLYRQTFHALNDVIGPLVASDAAVAAPMQKPRDGRALLVEVCPASTLIRHAMRVPYKKSAHASARVQIVDWLERTTPMAIPPRTRARVVQDSNGDAVDALIAAAAAWRASQARPSTSPLHRLEGFVYL